MQGRTPDRLMMWKVKLRIREIPNIFCMTPDAGEHRETVSTAGMFL